MKLGQRTTLKSGPFAGVRATSDPLDMDPKYLVDAKNIYIPDPQATSGVYGRPQFAVLNSGNVVYNGRGQGIYCHTMLDGTTINFLVLGGKLYRVSADLTTFTDVTPGGVAISSAITTRVFFASEAGALMVNDSVHRPWIATNLTSTPITGTYIDYDGGAVAWVAYGAPRIYQGSAFLILSSVNAVSRRADISWSSPGDFSTGWQQANFDYNWTLNQNEAGLLYALESDNLGLRYFRESSIGAASGQDVTTLSSTATDDALAFNIGTQAPQSIVKFGTGFFFCDAQGRPYWQSPGEAPQPIWKQMRTYVDESTQGNPTTTAIVATCALEPSLNYFLAAIWSPNPATQQAPIDIHVFDANTRIYQGHWSVSNNLSVECLGVLQDNAGRPTLVAITAGGYVWSFTAIGIATEDLTTEDGTLLTTEGGVQLTTEGGANVWQDSVSAQEVYALTDYLGLDEDVVWNLDMATALTSSAIPVTIAAITATSALVVEATPTPAASQNGTYRAVAGLEVFGRGPQIKVGPASFDAQFVLQRIAVDGVPSQANWDDA